MGWVIRETQCWNEYAFMDETAFPVYYANPQDALAFEGLANASVSFLRFQESAQNCDGKITLPFKEVTTFQINFLCTFDSNRIFSSGWAK